MKLKSTSISSKLYRWFYATEYLPTNLCPYFWKLVLAWLVLIPYSLVCLPMVIMELTDRGYKYDDNSTGKRIGMSAILYFMLFCVSSMIALICVFFTIPEKDSFYGFLAAIGGAVWILVIALCSIEGYKAFKDWNYRRKIKYDENGYRIWNEPKQKKTYLVVEFAKAKYNKYCPKIDWVDNK